jgi:membrane-bound lytic murein transglycosylase D
MMTGVLPSLAFAMGIAIVPVAEAQQQSPSGSSWVAPQVLAPTIAGDSDDQDDSGLPALMRSGLEGGLLGGAAAFLTPTDVLTQAELSRAVQWQPPAYDNQTGALGWSERGFDVPDKMKKRVAFWREIYARYTSDQGLIHDSVHVEVVYEPVDFTPIMRDQTLNIYQKFRLRERLVNERKKAIAARLRRLSQLKSPNGLSGDDLRVWRLFEAFKEPNKFKKAAEKNRVRFQLGQKDRFITGIFYSGRYLREMERIFRSEGLPIELTRLPFVESSFNIHARSKVGASGVWQFMPRTAKSFMVLNKLVDERNDPLRATLASARLLKQNYMMLGTWGLALTGYNHGPYGVRGIVNKLGTKDIAEIVSRYSSARFGFASENFYACFLAALEVEKNARTFFGDVKWSSELESVDVSVTRPIPYQTLLDFFDGDAVTTALLNPHFTSRVKTGKDLIPKGTFVRVHPERLKLAKEFLEGKTVGVSLALALGASPLPKGALLNSAATLTSTSGGVSSGPVETVTSAHGRLQKISAAAAAIFPSLTGKKAATPPPTATAEPATLHLDAPTTQSTPLPSPAPTPATRHYKVQPGDSLVLIAKKHGVSLHELERLNQLGDSAQRRNFIKAGQVLKLPPKTGAEAVEN